MRINPRTDKEVNMIMRKKLPLKALWECVEWILELLLLPFEVNIIKFIRRMMTHLF